MAASEDWQFQLSATSDRINRGLDQTSDKPSLGAEASWYPGAGAFANASVSSVRFFDAAPLGAEFIANAGYQWRWAADWSLQAMLSHYQFENQPLASHFEYDEIGLTGGWRDCLFASFTASPNTTYSLAPKARAFSYNLNAHLPLSYGFSAVAGVGYYDLNASLGAGFSYGDVGLVYQYRDVQFGISYVGTHGSERVDAMLGAMLVHRWVAQASWHF
ncbi:MAG TPA: hypothetical protein VG105_20850 [Paraburkholderia sp.]|jgi:uncharacterized protein (TIGR02001 family)|nr:hypothetical protein [Paraburkholderia sp.]